MTQTVTCKVCNRTVPKQQWNHVSTCGEQRCKDKWKKMNRAPGERASARDRNRKWCEEHRGTSAANPWLRGAPPYHAFLPGGGCEVHLQPGGQIPHSMIRLLHGMVSHLLDEDHKQSAGFTLLPWPRGCGWAVYSPSDTLRALANQSRAARIDRVPVIARFGMYTRLKAPQVSKRGHQRVRLSTITPVVVANEGRSKQYTEPTEDNLTSTLTRTLAPRLGVQVKSEDMRLEIVDADTEAVKPELGGHFGAVQGWIGWVDLDCNATARWLIDCAARGMGLGGRTALGFGRVRVVGV